MVRRTKGKRKPTSTAGKDASPRRGIKSKQTRVDNESGTGSPGPKQQKLQFTPTPNSTKPAAVIETSAAITPEPGKGVARLPVIDDVSHVSSTGDIDQTCKETETPTTSNIETPKPTTTKKITYAAATKPSPEDAKKAAKPSKKSTPKKKAPPYQEIRYRGTIETPPSEQPFEDFVGLLKKYITTVQKILGKGIHLAPWDPEQEATFPHIQLPSDVPASRESLGIYLGNYINPKQDGSRIYMNLRWITYKDPPVALERFGMELADALPNLKMSMTKQPIPCQSVKSGCIGWFMYSSKQINSKTFITETREALGIPNDIAIGISYRTITNEYGKKPPFNRDDPPPAAIHLDIDERYYMLFQPKASSLWRKKSKKRLPNEVQLRLVPCFSSPIGKSMTDDIRADAKTLAERQYFFVKEHLRSMEYHFISLLDTTLSASNNMTLRRAMMSRAPKDRPASRLIHNVDQSWNQPSKYIVTTVIGREEEANRFLTNLIPEILHTHGPEATKWFNSQGLTIYKDVQWNPTKGTTTSTHSKASAAMVEEDLWDLGPKWKSLAEKAPASERPDVNKLDKPRQQELPIRVSEIQERLAGDKSVASFRDTFGRDLDSDDGREASKLAAEEAAKPPEDLTGTQFTFSEEQILRDRERATNGSEPDGKSMSTAGKTTGSTRLALKEAQEQIAELRLALTAKSVPFDKLVEPEPASCQDSMDIENDNGPQEETEVENDTGPQEDTEVEDAMDTDFDPTDEQLLRSALSEQREPLIVPYNDAMEEARHGIFQYHPGLEPLPSSSSSDPTSDPSTTTTTSSEESSSDSSGVTHDTQELVDKLSSNQYNALSTIHKPKILTQKDRPGGSKSDSASHQSSGQESGSTPDHLQVGPSGLAGAVTDGAGRDD